MARKPNGFTLIELLVVIAIIAILAAILFPIFVRVQRIAKQSQCISNLGEVSKGIMMYATDHGSRLPCWQDVDAKNNFVRAWDTNTSSM